MTEVDPWVAPDTAAEPRPPTTSPPVSSFGITAVGTGTRVARGAPPPGLPVPLRPMTVGDVLDGSVRILKLAPRTVLLLAAAFVVPLQLVVALLVPDAVGAGEIGVMGLVSAPDGGLEFSGDLFVLGSLLRSLSTAFVCVGITHLVNEWYRGADRTPVQVFRAVGSRAVPALLAWILVHLAEALTLVGLFVGALVPMSLFLVAAPVVAEDGLGAWKALGRSRRLVQRRLGAVLGLAVLTILVDLLLSIALVALGSVYTGFALPYERVALTAISIAGLLVTVPFAAGVAALVHVDLRVRGEGLDIAIALPRRFPDA